MYTFECQICGVGMTIARFRAADEPQSAAWNCYGDEFPGAYDYFEHSTRRDPNCEDCTKFTRPQEQGPIEWPEQDEEDDHDWLPDESDSDDDEPLEYDSDDDELSDTPESNNDVDYDNSAGHKPPFPLHEMYEPIPGNRRVPAGTWQGNILYLQGGLERNHRMSYKSIYDHQPREDEHLPAPSCQNRRGINGSVMSMDEMRGCRSWRCLQRKQPGWKPSAHDQLFEADSSFMLTGEGNGSEEKDDYFLFPPRHGVVQTQTRPQNFPGRDADNFEWPLPAHTWCLDMYARVSTQLTGHVDLDGLWSWRDVEQPTWRTYQVIDPLVHHDAVQSGLHPSDEPWHHVPGAEWLVANPVDIPHLSDIVALCRRPNTAPQPSTAQTSLILSLPRELTDAILALLPLADLSNLHRTTRAFQSYTQPLFRANVLKNMPYLWEARQSPEYPHTERPVVWDALCPSWLAQPPWPLDLPYEEEEEDLWKPVLADHPDLGPVKEQAQAATRARRDEFDAASRARYAASRREWHAFRAGVDAWLRAAGAPEISLDSLDWARLWRLCAPDEHGAGSRAGARAGVGRGMRNRARIWGVCVDIVGRIEKYRLERKM